MIHLKFTAIIICFALGITAYSQTKVTAIQAKLFYNQKNEMLEKDNSGLFSQNIIDNPQFTLWNVDIGGGTAEGLSHQTIVIVEISNVVGASKNKILKFTATTGKKILLQQQKTISMLNEEKYKFLFLLDETGCEKILVKAEIVEKGKKISAMKKTILFLCGE